MNTAKTVRNIRKVERPRPLRLNSESNKSSLPSPSDNICKKKSTSDILDELNSHHLNLENCNFDENTVSEISKLSSILKARGEELETSHKDQMERFFVTLRNISRDDRLDVISRMKLLEIIEMNAMHWRTNENVTNYYRTKIFELEQGVDRMTLSGSSTSPNIPYLTHPTQVPPVNTLPLAPGEFLRSSGKFPKPTKIIGKQYVKDEIIIRNSDSGKVSPGARDRLVQITGPDEEAIGHAKNLVEDTIRRNASPVREKVDFLESADSNDLSNSYAVDNQAFSKNQLSHSFSMSDASVKEYSFPILIGRDIIKLSGKKLDLLKTAQLVLSEYFTGQLELQEKQNEILPPVSPHVTSPFSENFHGYDLKKENSLKNYTIQSPYTSSWTNTSPKLCSPSPFSSSEDEYIKENLDERQTSFTSNATSFNTISGLRIPETAKAPTAINNETQQGLVKDTRSANIREKFTRSSSVPTDVFTIENQGKTADVRRFSNEHVEVPVIPAPVDKSVKYDRNFLLSLAKSPLSQVKPADFDELQKNYSQITCKLPVIFDPTRYLQNQVS